MFEASRHPLVVAGKFELNKLNESFLNSIKENEGLLAMGFCPGTETEKIAAEIDSLKNRIGLDYLGIYPGFGHRINFSSLDKLFNLTLALRTKNFPKDDIKKILCNN